MGIDEFVYFISHFNGIDGSKEIVDSGNTGHIVTQNGGILSTAQKQFGNTSVSFSGGTTRLSIPDHSDWHFGSGDWTIDMWVRFTALGSTHHLCSQWGGGSNGSFSVRKLNTNRLSLEYSTNGTNIFSIDDSGYVFSDTNWHHIALVRDGNTLRFFVDGTATGTGSLTGVTLHDSTRTLNISSYAEGTQAHNGFIDELRISKGLARWTSGFTVPSQPYTSDANTSLLLHFESHDIADTVPHIPTFQGNAQIDTAQSKFGGASLLLDGTGDYVSTPDSADWDLGTDDFAIDAWVRFNDLGDNTVCARSTSGTSYMYLTFETGTSLRFRDYTGVNNVDFTRTVSVTTGVWYHVAVSRNGSNFRLFLDGVQQGATYVNSNAMTARSVGLDIGHMTQNAGYAFNGWIDEFRFSKGIARYTANFTPETEEYSTITSENVVVSEDLNISDTINIQTNPAQINISENLNISDDIIANSNPAIVSISEDLNISDVINAFQQNQANFATRILHVNPLYFVTDTDPIEIVEVDITVPTAPTWTIYVLDDTGITASNAKDFAINTTFDKIYVACADGQILELDLTNINNPKIQIDTGDLNDLETIASLNAFHNIYTGTNETSYGELIMIDNGEVESVSLDIRFLQTIEESIDLNINTLLGESVDFDIRFLEIIESAVGMDIRFLAFPYDELEENVIARPDVDVKINGVSVDDVQLLSVRIRHMVDDESTATFRVGRKHDRLNFMEDGTPSQITNQNPVQIYIQGRLEFTGNIASLQMQSEDEVVTVNCTAEEKPDRRHLVNIPMSSLNEKLKSTHCLLHNPVIDNPIVAADDINPKYFKGIRVPMGTRVEQSVSRYSYFASTQTLADVITKNTSNNPVFNDEIITNDGGITYSFRAKQNFTYFWFAKGRRLVGLVSSPTANGAFGSTVVVNPNPAGEMATLRYLGTSPSGMSGDLWEVTGMSYKKQRIFDDKYIKLGTGTVSISELDEICNDGTSVFNTLSSAGYISGGGTILDKFKKTKDATELTGVNIPGNEIGDVYSLLENNLGYTVGSAPFKDVSARSGIFIPKDRWEDDVDGLYVVRDKGYDFTNFVQEVAQLEYQKLKNINGQVLPATSGEVEILLDAYYYYGISLLTRINISNTTTPDIYKNNNGFPTSVKAIEIDCGAMRVRLTTDNQWSIKELEEIDSELPDDTADAYNFPEKRTLNYSKFDPNRNEATG